MPTLACPACQTLTRHLDFPSEGATVNYYRCLSCSHVWTVSKTDPLRIAHVTPLPKSKNNTRAG